ncbi:MAG: sensory rhodopsin transducer [Dehalococcoidales bacterium]|nr:sensory rhodopsin transducer [Dehalococcoidales bacterium]
MGPLGHTAWAIPGGHIPLHSTGREPDYTSRDELHMLNTGDKDARIEITIYYSDRGPVGPYPLTVPAQRVRCVRFNDLINPEAIYLDTNFAAIIRSDVPILVQFSRLDSGQPAKAILSTMAFPV